MGPSFFFVFVVAVMVAVVVASSIRARRVNEVWSAVAADLGLNIDTSRFGQPTLSGSMAGHIVDVDAFRQRRGKNTDTFTRYRVQFPRPDFDLRLTRQSGVSRITTWFGAQDIESGHEEFDSTFVVRASNEPAALAWLDAGRRGALIRAAAAYPGLEVENGILRYRSRGFESDRRVLLSTIRRMVDTAEALAGREANRRAEAMLEARRAGELAELADRIRRAAETPDQRRSLDERIVEADTLATAGERDQARRRLRELRDELPADPDIEGWRERLDQPVVPAGAVPSDVGAKEVSEALFGGTALSYESKQMFDRTYRGARVRWTGAFKSASSIGMDSDLGPDGGTKLLLTVATIDHDLYGNTEIDAVVGLSETVDHAWRRGDPVTFSGTLVRVDALVRNLFVANAELV